METIKKITHEEIFTELEVVLKFNSLKSAPILSKFLKYIVEETLNENQHFIKEYSIAINVLNRSSDFNSNDDAVVRIHAGRLRRILNEYYLTEGIHNSLIIDIPKGCYIPQFHLRETMRPIVHPHKETNPIIAIFPFKSITQEQNLDTFSLMLCEELSAELSLFEEISVVAHFSSEIISKINQNILEAAKTLGANFIITGNLQSHNKKLQIRVNLLNSITGEFVMTKSFEYENIEDIAKIQNEIVQSVVRVIGGYYGIIFKEIVKTLPNKISDSLSIWKGLYSYYQYQRSYSLKNYKTAIFNLKEAVKLHPDHATTWAMLAEFHLDGLAIALYDDKKTIDEAYHCAMKALKIDCNCQHAWHALTWVSLYRRDPEACFHAAQQCIKINPNASGLVSGVGCMMIFGGYFETGFQIMDDAIKTNSCYPWWINIGYSYYYIYKKDYANAFYWAEKMESEESIWAPLLKAVTLSFINEDERAKEYLNKLIEIHPTISNDVNGILSGYMLTDKVVVNIIESLKKIGLEVVVA